MNKKQFTYPFNSLCSETMEGEGESRRRPSADDEVEPEERIIYGVEDTPLPHLTVVFALQVS